MKICVLCGQKITSLAKLYCLDCKTEMIFKKDFNPIDRLKLKNENLKKFKSQNEML